MRMAGRGVIFAGDGRGSHVVEMVVGLREMMSVSSGGTRLLRLLRVCASGPGRGWLLLGTILAAGAALGL